MGGEREVEEGEVSAPEGKDGGIDGGAGSHVGGGTPRTLSGSLAGPVSDGERRALQGSAWDAMVRGIDSCVGRVCAMRGGGGSDVRGAVVGLFQDVNVLRGGDLLVQSVWRECVRRGPRVTVGLAGLVAAVNARFPAVGLRMLDRVVWGLGDAWRRRDDHALGALGALAAHLVNHGVAHEILVLELVAVLLKLPAEAQHIHVGVAVLVAAGKTLSRVAPRATAETFEALRGMVRESQLLGISQATVRRIEEAVRARKAGWANYPPVPRAMEGLAGKGGQIMHDVGLDKGFTEGGDHVARASLSRSFHFDPDFEASEARYAVVRDKILREFGPRRGANMPEGAVEAPKGESVAGLGGDGDRVAELERQVHLTIMSSLNARESAHKLLALRAGQGREALVARCVVERCAKERTYSKHFGLLVDELCVVRGAANRGEPYARARGKAGGHKSGGTAVAFAEGFGEALRAQYAAVDALPVNEIRNVGRLAAHVLASGSVPWGSVLQAVTLTEDGTTASGRIFLKILFQEAADRMSPADFVAKATAEDAGTASVFRRTSLREARFCINFFYSIRLPFLAAPLEAWIVHEAARLEAALAARGDGGGGDSSSSSSSSSDSDSESDSELASTSDSVEDGGGAAPVGRAAGDAVVLPLKRKLDQGTLRTRYDSSDSDDE